MSAFTGFLQALDALPLLGFLPIGALKMRTPGGGGGGGGGPAYVSTGAHAANSLVANYPASIAAGDYLLASVILNATPDAHILTPSGWERITRIHCPVNTGIQLFWFYKVADGTESGTLTFTQSGGIVNVKSAAISRFTGAASFESVVGKMTTNHSTVAISSPAVTTAGANRLIVNGFATDSFSTFTEEAGWTEGFDYNNNGGGGNNYNFALHYAASSGTGVQTTEEPTPFVSTEGVAMAAIALAGSGSMPSLSISVRGSRLTWVNNASSIVFSLPPGSQAGDRCDIAASNGWSVNTPAGWVTLVSLTGSNTNGAAFSRILTAADIATGSVTITFANAYYGIVGGITFVGCTGGLRDFAFTRNGSGSSTRNVTTSGPTPQAGDYAVYMGQCRGNSTVTCNQGSSLQTSSNSEGSGCIYGGVLGSSGAVSATFSYSAVPSGDFQGIFVIAPTA